MSTLLKKGAEAYLFLEDWHGRKVIMKRRISKEYRVPELDREIRRYRTLHEPRLMHSAKEAGVPTPTIFMIDLAESTIVMEFIEGKQVKQVLNGIPKEERLQLCRRIGVLIGQLHKNGIIHGDLTTSNMILTPNGRIVFVDFGLGEYSKELEIKGVDMHLMKRAFQSTHYRFAQECFEAVMQGYGEIVGEEEAKNVLGKIAEIEKRGRYIAERKEKQ